MLSILYSVVYMPTLALSNSMAFANLADRDRQFPQVRVWGTIGWIAASWIFPMIYLQTGLHFGAMPPFLTGPELPNVTARLADSLRFSGDHLLGLRALLPVAAAHAAQEGRRREARVQRRPSRCSRSAPSRCWCSRAFRSASSTRSTSSRRRRSSPTSDCATARSDRR